MNDPIRFLDPANDAMPFERAALRAGQNIEPPLGAKEKIWAALGPQIGPDGGGDGGGNGGGDGGASSSGNTFSQGASAVNSSGASISGTIGGAKIFALGAAGASAIAGVVAAVSALTSPAPVSSNIQQPAPIVASAFPAIEETPAPTIQNETPPVESPAPPAPPEKHAIASANPRIAAVKPKEEKVPASESANVEGQERASRLREENRLLGDARSALRGGDPAEALKKLDAAGGRFPDGVLAQEREVLAIEALAKSGRRDAASARATAFLSAHPTSPHATKVRSFVQK